MYHRQGMSLLYSAEGNDICLAIHLPTISCQAVQQMWPQRLTAYSISSNWPTIIKSLTYHVLNLLTKHRTRRAYSLASWLSCGCSHPALAELGFECRQGWAEQATRPGRQGLLLHGRHKLHSRGHGLLCQGRLWIAKLQLSCSWLPMLCCKRALIWKVQNMHELR